MNLQPFTTCVGTSSRRRTPVQAFGSDAAVRKGEPHEPPDRSDGKSRCGEFHSSATRTVSAGPGSSVSHLASLGSTVVDLPTRPVRRQHFRSVAPLLRLGRKTNVV